MASPMPQIAASTPIARSPNAATAEVDGQLVALDVTKGICFGMNEVATAIWGKLAEPTTTDAIVDALLDDYEIDRDTCAEQALELVRDLVNSGLAQPA